MCQLHRPMNALPRVEWQGRHGSVLHPVPLGKHGEVMGLNLVARRGRRWGYCFASAPLTCLAEHVVYLFADTPEQLSAELGVTAERPRAVFVGGPVDPFAPVSEIQGQTREIIEVLANHDVETWLMTRGFIRPAALRVLESHRRRVRLTVGLTTLDREMQPCWNRWRRLLKCGFGKSLACKRWEFPCMFPWSRLYRGSPIRVRA